MEAADRAERLESGGNQVPDFPPAGKRLMARLTEIALEQQLARETPKLRRKVRKLSDAWANNSTKTLGGIVRTNSFADGGLFYKMSRINHSCSPNSVRRKISKSGPGGSSGVWEVVALRDIKPGEEITIDYGAARLKDVKERRKFLKETYNFWCECARCSREAGEVVVGGAQHIEL